MFVIRAWLIRNGFPPDQAWEMPEYEALAYYVVFGQFDGNTFDWDRLQWERKD